MLKPTHLTIENFRAIISLDIDLPEVLVLAGPNGSGKTSVLQAIEWCLTGRVVDPRGVALVQSKYVREGQTAEVSLTLCDEQGEETTVVRTLGAQHKVRLVTHEDGAARASGDIAIKDWPEWYKLLTGCTIDQTTALLRSDRFLSMSSSEQGALIMSLLDVRVSHADLLELIPDESRELAGRLTVNAEDPPSTLFERLSVFAVEERRGTKRELQTARGRLAQAEEAEVSLRAEYETAQADIGPPLEAGEAEAQWQELESTRRHRLVHEETVKRHADELQRLDTQLAEAAAEQTDLRTRLTSAEQAVEDYQATHAGLVQEIAAHEAREQTDGQDDVCLAATRTTLAVEVRTLEEQIVVMDTAGEAARCPLCGAEADLTAVRQDIDARLSTKREHLREATRKAETAQRESADLARALGSARSQLTSLTMPSDPEELRKGIKAVSVRRRKIDEQRRTVVDHRNAATTALHACAPEHELVRQMKQVDQHREWNAKLGQAAEAIQASRGTYQRTERELSAAEALADAWNPAELTTKLLLSQIGELLERVNGPLLQGMGYEASIAPGIEVQVKGMGETWAPDELSKGQQMMLAAAWQAGFAQTLGLGIVLLDDASILDRDNLQTVLADVPQAYEGIVWIVPRPEPPMPSRWSGQVLFKDGVVAESSIPPQEG